MNFRITFLLLSMLVLFGACTKEKEETPTGPYLIFKYTFDENGVRQDNFGDPAVVPSGHATQTPDFHKLGIHSIELIDYVLSFPTSSTVIYKGEEKSHNGEVGIDFSKEKIVEDGEVLVKIPISSITPGTYTYLRNSLGYQNYTIDFIYNDPTLGTLNLNAEMASFVGFKTYISDFNVGGATVNVNGIVDQGYWAYHIAQPVALTETGQAPGTTVPNPLDAVSPIPLGSCLVTGAFTSPLTITGGETNDITIEVAVSINESFEWVDSTPDGLFEPASEVVVDMGTRGLKATIQ